MEWLVLAYLGVINLAALWMMGADKSRARKKRRRIPEKRLLWTGALGGALGLGLGMRIFHHKTRHAAFQWGVPLLIVLHFVLIYYLFIAVWDYGR